MATNLLDQLQDTEVPPPPVMIRREVHDRLNQWLLVAQIAELVVYGFGHAAAQFGATVLGLMNFTLTGEYSLKRDNEEDKLDDNTNDQHGPSN